MILIEHEGKCVRAVVFGEFTLADYREFEELALYKIRFEGDVDLLFDLTRMEGATLDVAWADLCFTRDHPHDFCRIAVVSQSQWVNWSACLTRAFVSADIRLFSDIEDAQLWLADDVSGAEGEAGVKAEE